MEDEIGSSNRPFSSQGNSIDGWEHCIHGEDQIFASADEFRIYSRNYSIATRKSYTFKKNELGKIQAVCTDKNCKWRIYASKRSSDTIFAIRKCTLQPTCGDDMFGGRGHPKANPRWVANIVKEISRGEPSYRPVNITEDIQREFGVGVDVAYQKAWTGKENAMSDIFGKEEASYNRLRWLCAAVCAKNPGSRVEYENFEDTNKFRRVFICFSACLLGFIGGCPPLIFLDEIHIKTKFKGYLLSVVAKDPNDDLFTLSYGRRRE